MVAIIKPIPCITGQIPFLNNHTAGKCYITHNQYVWKEADIVFGKF